MIGYLIETTSDTRASTALVSGNWLIWFIIAERAVNAVFPNGRSYSSMAASVS